MLLAQLMLDGAMLDDKHIAWASDIDHQFGDVAPTNFNTVPSLRGGGSLNGTLQVSLPSLSATASSSGPSRTVFVELCDAQMAFLRVWTH